MMCKWNARLRLTFLQAAAGKGNRVGGGGRAEAGKFGDERQVIKPRMIDSC